MRKILFVCHGNICRSVMAEYILKNKTNEIYCESAATSNDEIGNDIYPPVKVVLDAHGIKYSKHHARRITKQDYDRFDEIYIMDDRNLRYISNIIDDTKGKIKKLCNYDIDDPWFTGRFEEVYKQIEEGVTNLIK